MPKNIDGSPLESDPRVKRTSRTSRESSALAAWATASLSSALWTNPVETYTTLLSPYAMTGGCSLQNLDQSRTPKKLPHRGKQMNCPAPSPCPADILVP